MSLIAYFHTNFQTKIFKVIFETENQVKLFILQLLKQDKI